MQVDHNGKMNGKYRSVALAGFMRRKGQSDACLNRLFGEMEILSFKA